METLELSINDSVAWVRLSRPNRLNAIDQLMLDELDPLIDTLATAESVRVIVITGRGTAFSAGFDVAWMAQLDPRAVADGLDRTRSVFERWESCAKPLIAAVNGPAAGGGLLLAMAADFRIGSDAAQIGVPEVKIGIFPSLGLIPRLKQLVGTAHAKRLVMTGEPWTALEAEKLGLLHKVVPQASLEAETRLLATTLAALPSQALRLCKETFRAAGQPGFNEWEREQFMACWGTPERAAAMRAFLKRDL